MLNVDGWTDERTNGRKLARLCLPAKAGATKSEKPAIFCRRIYFCIVVVIRLSLLVIIVNVL